MNHGFYIGGRGGGTELTLHCKDAQNSHEQNGYVENYHPGCRLVPE